jgi:hypothetical protein
MMNFKRYLNKFQQKTDAKQDVSNEKKTEIKKNLSFVDPDKNPDEYIKRYLKESKYKDWFNRNYPNFTIYEAVGLTASDYLKIKRQLFPESKYIENVTPPAKQTKSSNELSFKPTHEHDTKTRFDEFIDERILVSHNAFGDKEMKIKIIEISDENPTLITKFGNRVKINKILITIKHLENQQIEESEFDIEEIESELIEKRHYTSTNRWVPTDSIKNGYIINTRHTSLISDAMALDYIIF